LIDCAWNFWSSTSFLETSIKASLAAVTAGEDFLEPAERTIKNSSCARICSVASIVACRCAAAACGGSATTC
jgi:hypothetical protein